jgi:hypothetical protein
MLSKGAKVLMKPNAVGAGFFSNYAGGLRVISFKEEKEMSAEVRKTSALTSLLLTKNNP